MPAILNLQQGTWERVEALYKIKEKYMWHGLVKDVVEKVSFVQNDGLH